MSARVIDGKALAAQLRAELTDRIAALVARGLTPGLAVLLVGDDPASAIYVRNKIKACQEAGIRSFFEHLPDSVAHDAVLERIRAWNDDARVHGILVQLPLPPRFDAQQLAAAIDPRKDVDGLHPENAGLLLLGRPRLPCCTPAGVMRMLAAAGCDPAGKHAVVIGRSNMVGKPMAMLLLAADATVTLCHSHTRDLRALARQADILVAAAGRPGLVTAEMVKPGAVVIDVGIHRTPDGRIVGDVAFDSVRAVAGAISPVPGGVGPMTIAMLLINTVRAAELIAATASAADDRRNH